MTWFELCSYLNKSFLHILDIFTYFSQELDCDSDATGVVLEKLKVCNCTATYTGLQSPTSA